MKNATYIILLFVFGAFNMSAQEDNNIEVSLNYSIGQSFRSITSDDNLYLSFRESDGSTINQGIELQVRLKLNEQFGFSSGIGYQQYGDKNSFYDMSMYEDPVTGFNYEIVYWHGSVITKYRYDFISVPILLDYKLFNKGKNQVDLNFGSTLNFYLDGNKISRNSNSGGIGGFMKPYSFSHKKIAFSGQITLLYKRSINDNSFIKIGPKFDYFFTSIAKYDYFNYFPYKTSFVLAYGF